ncbi:LysM peptidoglycan-binding domain-containing protein [Aquibacillus albus]|uniref:LysM repeat protein n=1 Tax=Aquibacillus albus TaxID=1168171 RepID=A0ABS2MV68_9BACI|nr:LysM peptidoglycan-binding domain-containing protein [Aquibacillus albus]MBM7569797.1 LysM repeat protein [Aquibacillus albus]
MTDKAFENQASNLQDMVDEINNNREKPKNNDNHSPLEAEDDLGILDLPPRSQVHAGKKAKMKWKISFPLVRLLFVLFLLIVGLVLTYQVWGKDLLETSSAKQSMEQNPAGELVQVKFQHDDHPVKDTIQISKEEKIVDSLTNSNENRTLEESTNQDEEVNINEEANKQQTNKNEVRTHVVKKGDTLFSIAMFYYGNKQGEKIIMEANGLTDKTVKIGQSLSIPFKTTEQ